VIALVVAVMGFVAAPNGVSAKTLKIGCLLDFGFPLGIQAKRELEVIVPAFNKKGGLVIQGQRYNIDLITYDTKMSAETARAAVERLIYRDKVKFILGDETTDAWAPVTEANKILVVCLSPSPAPLSPKHKYIFQASSLHTMSPVAWAWFSETYPQMKTVGSVFTDDLKGHAEAGKLRRLCGVFGQKILDIIFYPPDTTDFSAIATRLKNLNPDVFTTCAGGPVQDSLAMKSLKQAGWDGQIFLYVTLSPGNIEKVISLDWVEGMLGSVTGTEMDSPPPLSQELRDIYIAKYGKWDNPEVLHVNTWYFLMAALKQAQSLDPDKVADTITKGMKFVTPQAPAITISRPDLKNPRAIDSLYEVNIARIKKGKFELVQKIPIEKGREYLEILFAGKPVKK
jgi:branched-chain amino acid transport system substrate-binding protein